MNRKTRIKIEKGKMTRRIAILLSMCLLLSVLAGCGKKKDEKSTTEAELQSETQSDTQAETEVAEGSNGDALSNRESKEGKSSTDSKVGDSDNNSNKSSASKQIANSNMKFEPGKGTINNATYVMIYNPLVYDELNASVATKTSLNSGKLGSQVVTGIKRADNLAEANYPVMVTPRDVSQGIENIEIQEVNDKAGTVYQQYLGDTISVYAFDDQLRTRQKKTFTCIYVGKECYVYDLDGTVSAKDAEMIGKEFDDKIFPADTNEFGKGRFTEGDGKVYILMQPMADGLCGFFSYFDNFAYGEVDTATIEANGINTDRAIININSRYLAAKPDMVKSTLAHEYQHLISSSDSFEKGTYQTFRTWYDETMSAHAEEMVYPGLKKKEGFDQYMFISENYIHGQSLFNFDTTNDANIGAYGAVYLFSLYLDKIGKPYGSTHTLWRMLKQDTPPIDECLTDAFKSTPTIITYDSSGKETSNNTGSENYAKILDSKYVYPDSIKKKFSSDSEMMMSKLALDFYLDSLKIDFGDITNDIHAYMLYDSVNACKIEGGGRIIVALSGDSFTIPADADDSLIYIGLDSDFNPVTGLITK